MTTPQAVKYLPRQQPCPGQVSLTYVSDIHHTTTIFTLGLASYVCTMLCWQFPRNTIIMVFILSPLTQSTCVAVITVQQQ